MAPQNAISWTVKVQLLIHPQQVIPITDWSEIIPHYFPCLDGQTHTQSVATGAQVFCNCLKSAASKLPKTPEQASFFFV